MTTQATDPGRAGTQVPATEAHTAATHLMMVRHGQSLYNRDGPEAGDDSGLTELGWQQAELAAGWLAQNYRFDVLVCSPLLRARQTAEVISREVGLPILVRPGLEEAEHSYLHEFAPAMADPLEPWDQPWQPTPDVAPIYSAFRARLRAVLADVLATYAGQTILMVCHGGVIGTILRSTFGAHQVVVETENTGVAQMTWEHGCWRLVAHNLTEHLAPLRPIPH
jgi:broad specificity phosphatase PhoE